jgi:xylitol oxidase
LDAISALLGLGEQFAEHLYISELRSVAEDDLWMSPCYRQPSVAIHFTWRPDWASVRNLLPAIEERLQPFDARPHWGKLFAMPPPRLHSLYERAGDWLKLRASLDPDRKFVNEFLAANLGA